MTVGSVGGKMESEEQDVEQPFCLSVKGLVKMLRLVRTGAGGQVTPGGLGRRGQHLRGHLVSSHAFPDARHCSVAQSAGRRTVG